MANGVLGKAALVAGVYTPIYTVTANKVATINIRVINNDPDNSVNIRLAICPASYVANAVPADADWIEPIDLSLSPAGVLEDTAIAMTAGEILIAYASGSKVTVRAHGFESLPNP